MRDLELVLLQTSLTDDQDPASLPQLQRLIQSRICSRRWTWLRQQGCGTSMKSLTAIRMSSVLIFVALLSPQILLAKPLESKRMERAKDLIADEQWCARSTS